MRCQRPPGAAGALLSPPYPGEPGWPAEGVRRQARPAGRARGACPKPPWQLAASRGPGVAGPAQLGGGSRARAQPGEGRSRLGRSAGVGPDPPNVGLSGQPCPPRGRQAEPGRCPRAAALTQGPSGQAAPARLILEPRLSRHALQLNLGKEVAFPRETEAGSAADSCVP